MIERPYLTDADSKLTAVIEHIAKRLMGEWSMKILNVSKQRWIVTLRRLVIRNQARSLYAVFKAIIARQPVH